MAVTVIAWNAWRQWQYFLPVGVKHVSVGHTALQAPGAYISWAGGSRWCSWEHDQKEYRDKGAEELSVTLHTLDETAIVSWWARFKETDPSYFFFGLNCAKVVALALYAGGSREQATGIYRHSDLNLIWSPRDAYRYACSLQR